MAPAHGPQPSADALYDNAACGLVLARPDGVIVRANATFCSWVGYSADALVGRRRVQDLLPIGARVFHQTHWQPLLHIQGSVSEIKVDLVRSDGRHVPVLVNTVRRAHDGEMLDELAFFVATDRHKYEQELLRARGKLHELNAALADADRRKDEFLATLAHELRNPLAPIRNVLHLLSAGPPDAARLEWSVQILDRQVRHMTRLVDDLSEISRITQGKIELRKTPVELVAVLTMAAETARPTMESAGLDFTLQLPAAPIQLVADETRLSQILQNLLTNAAKYTPQGGCVVLAADRTGDVVTIRVRDSGIGIAAADLPRVFDMFAQVTAARAHSDGGLGIGLALVRGLVELHGGTVAVTSEGTGKGSEFTVTLRVER